MKRFGLVLGMLTAGWVFCAATAGAADLYVSPNGDWDGGVGGATYSNIQTAVTAASPGDTIFVTNGVYSPIATSNKAITIRAVSTNPADTVIDGGWDGVSGSYVGNQCANLAVNRGSLQNGDQTNTVLIGFTLRNGSSERSDYDGGGGAVGGTLISCVITNCFGGLGGGVHRSVLYSCLVTENTGGHMGGGAWESTLHACVVTGNTAEYEHGGGVARGTLVNCVVVGNAAGEFGYGGGVWGDENVPITLVNSIVWGNTQFDGISGDNMNGTILSTHSIGGENDPGFVNWAAGDFRLFSDSPARLDGYPNAVVWPYDFEGNPMLENGSVNIGAFAGAVTTPSDLTLSISPADIQVNSFSTNVAFTVTAANAWGVTAMDSWLAPVVHQGAAGTNLVVNCAVEWNSSTNARTGRLWFSSYGSNVWVTVTQKGRVPLTNVWVNQGQTQLTPDGLTMGTAFREIDDALTVLSESIGAGDTIWVLNGEYRPFAVTTEGVSIRSLAENPAAVVVDGGGTNRCATLMTDTVLEGFTLRNGGGVEQGGGAFYGILKNCILTNNHVTGNGGGAFQSVLTDCVVVGNSAQGGGGVDGGSATRCTVMSNQATDTGGGGWSVAFYQCLILNNTAGNEGGGARSSPSYSCIVAGNTAGLRGGGTFGSDLYNCTVTGNSAPDGGGTHGGNLRNSIIWGNTNSSGAVNNLSTNGTATACHIGTNADPAQDNPKFADAANGNYALLSASPCVDAGNTDLVASARPLDYFGNALIENSMVNQGAVAGRVAATYYVAADAAGQADGLGWATAFPTIQQAVDNVGVGDTIIVSNGVYAPISTANKAITIRALSTNPADTVIDGGWDGIPNSANGAHCALLAENVSSEYQTNTVLIGFTLRNGYPNAFHGGGGALGGTLVSCVISNCFAWQGGGAYQSALNACLLIDNTAEHFGGGSSAGILINCTVVGNTAGLSFGGVEGGGLSGASLVNSIVWGNTLTNGTVDNIAMPSEASTIGHAENPWEDEPGFVNWMLGDFRLFENSRCRFSGNPNFVVWPVDLHGNPIIESGFVNQGALAGGVVRPEEAPLSISAPNTSVSAVTTNVAFTVTASNAWGVRAQDAWLIPVVDSDTAGTNLVVNFELERNIHTNARTGQFWFSSYGSNVVVEITQAGHIPLENVYVNQAQTQNTPDGLTWATAFREIDDALTALSNRIGEGDTIWVTNGVYRPFTASEAVFLIRAAPGADVVVDGGGTNRCATLAENTVLEGFTLQNGSAYNGAGAYSGTLRNCVITNNHAEHDGGGAYASILTDCVVTDNSAPNGAGMYNSTATRCTVVGNHALKDGGGVRGGSLVQSLLKGNTAGEEGGGADLATLYSCIVVGNTAGMRGGGSSGTDNYNCTVTGNAAPDGGGAYNGHLRNSIIWGNTDANGALNNMGSRGTVTACYVGTNADPALDAPQFADAENGDYTLTKNSPCVDAGDTGSVHSTYNLDYFGNALIQNSKVNQGAIAGRAAGIYYVAAGSSAVTPDGFSWATAFPTIQQAVDIAAAGDRVIVSNGVYAPISTANKAITIESLSGSYATIIDGSNTTRCATLGGKNETNTILRGFTIRKGYVSTSDLQGYGAGVIGGTVEDCEIHSNNSDYAGGGVAYSIVRRSSIFLNSAVYGGGATDATLFDCSINRNTATNYGGGTHYSTLERCRVSGNTAGSGGGMNEGSVRYSFIVNNTATNGGGGGIHGRAGQAVRVLGCTVVNNETTGGTGAGIVIAGTGNITNSIIWGNRSGSTTVNLSLSAGTVVYSCSTPLPAGEGNIADDPCMENPSDGKFNLFAMSPCLQAGLASAASAADTGLDELPMLANGKINMGAYGGWIEQYATNSVPYSWLLQNQLLERTTIAAAYDAAAMADTGKGTKVWEEFVAGTHPQSNDVFRITNFFINSNGWPVVEYWPFNVAGRTYSLHGEDSLTNGEWDTPTNAARFFHIRVTLDE